MRSAEEIAEGLVPFAEAGASHVVLGDLTGTTYAPEDTAHVLGSELPRLKRLIEAV